MLTPKPAISAKSKSLGPVKIRHITVGDLLRMSRLAAAKGDDDRRFVVKAMAGQMQSPEVTATELGKIGDDELRSLTNTLIEHEPHAFEFHKKTCDFCADFRQAIEAYQLEQIKRMTKSLNRLMPLEQRLMPSKAAMRSLERYQEQVRRLTQIRADLAPVVNANVLPLLLTPPAITTAVQQAMSQLRRFSEQFASIIVPAIDSQNNAIRSTIDLTAKFERETMKALADRMPSYLASMRDFVGMADRVHRQLAPQIEALLDWASKQHRLFEPTWEKLKRLAEEAKLDEQEVAKTLRKYKWFVSPSMPAGVIQAILKVAKGKGRKDREINSLFVGYFSEDDWKNLENIVAGWASSRHLKPRLPILMSCVRVLQATKPKGTNASAVVLPTLISQIDGFLTDYLEFHGIPFKTSYDDFVQGGKVKKQGRKSQFKANLPHTLSRDLDELAMDVLLNVLFQGSRRGQPLGTPFNFNRHKVMHGESLKFGRKDYVVRAFMVLDFLSQLK